MTENLTSPVSTGQPGVRRLERSRSTRMIAGVAGGIAEYFNVDVTIVRLALVITSFFGGAGLVAYIAGWLLMPESAV